MIDVLSLRYRLTYALTEDGIMGKLSPEAAAKNRERQRRWREKAFNPEGYGLNRVNVALDTHAAAALKRLTAGYGLTQRDLIERLLSAADSEIAETIGHERRAAYYDGKLEAGALGAFDLIVVQRAPIPSATLLSDDRHADADADDAHVDTGKYHVNVNVNADGGTEATNADATAEIEPTDFTLAPSRLSKPERERLVLDAHALGHGSRAIAKLTGIGESSARLILRRHGLANEQRVPMPD